MYTLKTNLNFLNDDFSQRSKLEKKRFVVKKFWTKWGLNRHLRKMFAEDVELDRTLTGSRHWGKSYLKWAFYVDVTFEEEITAFKGNKQLSIGDLHAVGRYLNGVLKKGV